MGEKITHIGHIEIKVISNQDPNRIARAVVRAQEEATRDAPSADRITYYTRDGGNVSWWRRAMRAVRGFFSS